MSQLRTAIIRYFTKPLLHLFCVTALCLPLNSNGQQKRGTEVTVDGKDSTAKGNTYALLIGINYTGRKKIKPLSYAVNDAELLKSFLVSGSFFDSIPEKNFRTLLDKEANSGELGFAFLWLDTIARPGDKVIIYFAGHGIASGPDEGYLIAYNAPDVSDPTLYGIQGGSIPVEWLKKKIRQLRGRRVTTYLITDACRHNERKDKSQLNFQTILEADEGEIQFTSCSRDQSSLEDQKWGGGHGLFTYYLVKGLYGFADDEGSRDNKVSLFELENYVRKYVSDESRNLVENIPEQIPYINIRNAYPGDVIAFVKNPALKEQFREGNLLASVKRSITQDTSELMRRYQQSLDKKIFFPEQEGNAYSILQQIKAGYPDQQYKEALQEYIISLLNDGQLRVNKYFEGEDIVYTTRFFEKGARALEIALSLMAKNHPLYKVYIINRLFLEAHRYWGNYSKFEFANAKLDSAIALDSTIAYLYNAKGLLAKATDRHHLAIEYFKKAQRLSPGWWFPTWNIADIYSDLGEFEKTKTIFYSQLHSKDSAVWFNSLGKFYTSRKIYDSARLYFRKAVHAAPMNTRYLDNIGEMYVKKGYLDSALLYYSRSLDIDSSAGTFHDIADVYVKKGQFKKALEITRMAIDMDSSSIYSWFYLGQVYYYQQEYDSAFKYVTKALSSDSQNITLNGWLGITYHDRGEYTEAKQVYQRLLKADPDNNDYWGLLADVYNDEGLYDSARYSLHQALQVDSTDPYAWNSLGNYFYRTGKYDSAKRSYQRILLLNPRFATAYLNLGFVSLKNSNKKIADSASYYFKKAISLDPTRDDAYIQLSAVYRTKNQPDLALKYLRIVYPYYPKNKELINELASAFLDKKQYDSVLHYHQKVYSTTELFDPFITTLSGKSQEQLINYYKAVISRTRLYDSILLTKIGEHYFYKKQYNLALPYYESLYKKIKKLPNETLQNISDAYMNTKQPLKAIALYKAMINIDSTQAAPYFKLAYLYRNKPGSKELVYDYYLKGLQHYNGYYYYAESDSAVQFVGDYLLEKNRLPEYIRFFKDRVGFHIQDNYGTGKYLPELVLGFKKAGMQDSAEIYNNILDKLYDTNYYDRKSRGKYLMENGLCTEAIAFYTSIISTDKSISQYFPAYRTEPINIANLLYCYTKTGRLDSAAKYEKRLTMFSTNDYSYSSEYDIYFALACFYAANSQPDSALIYTEKMLEYLDESYYYETQQATRREKLMSEPLLGKLRETPGFRSLLEKYKQKN